MSTVGKNILRLRKEMGMTQEELAKRMGYTSKSTINKIEMGKSDIPQSKIVKFAEVLGTTPAHLMGWEEEKTRFTHSMENYSVAASMLAQINSPDQMILTEGEKMLIELFRQIPEDAQKMYLEVLRASLKNQQ